MTCDHGSGHLVDSLDQYTLCIPLYVLSKEYIRVYKDCLKQINLTFTQFLVMMVLWRMDDLGVNEMKVKEIGNCLCLDSGTLTPVLKKLETKSFVWRSRSQTDARDLCISLTDQGGSLRKNVLIIQNTMRERMNLSPDKALRIDSLLRELLSLLAEEFEQKTGKGVITSLKDFIKTEDKV